MSEKFKILILGSSGMLGHTLLRYFNLFNNYDVFGTLRSNVIVDKFYNNLSSKIILNVDVNNENNLYEKISEIKPNLIINCIGIIKQHPLAKEYTESIKINSLFPHLLAKISSSHKIRLIHFSTDCVFSGLKGNYTEEDIPDPTDLYGRTKLLGELDYPNTLTLRTSIIGKELKSNFGLVSWFLSQTKNIKGFRKAIFSGLPTIEIARIIHEYIIPNDELSGLFHLSVDPISKLDILKLLNKTYKKELEIIPYDELIIDRSLNSTKFKNVTNYSSRPWEDLIEEMYRFEQKY